MPAKVLAGAGAATGETVEPAVRGGDPDGAGAGDTGVGTARGEGASCNGIGTSTGAPFDRSDACFRTAAAPGAVVATAAAPLADADSPSRCAPLLTQASTRPYAALSAGQGAPPP